MKILQGLEMPKNCCRFLLTPRKLGFFFGGPTKKKNTQRQAAFLLSLVFKYEAKIKMELENDKRKRTSIQVECSLDDRCHCALSFSKKGVKHPVMLG